MFTYPRQQEVKLTTTWCLFVLFWTQAYLFIFTYTGIVTIHMIRLFESLTIIYHILLHTVYKKKGHKTCKKASKKTI